MADLLVRWCVTGVSRLPLPATADRADDDLDPKSEDDEIGEHLPADH